MKRPLLLLLGLGLLLAASPLASAQAQGPAPIRAATRTEVPLPPRPELLAGHLRLRIEQGVSFRWSDGDWIARVELTVRNVSSQPIVVPRAAFVAAGWRPWDNVSTFPENEEVPAGGTLRGTIGWYQSRALPRPPSIRIGYGHTQVEQPLAYSESETRAHGAPGTGAEHLSVAVDPLAETWLHTDGDRVLRFRIRIHNPSADPVVLAGSHLIARMPIGEGTRWGQASSLPDPIRIEPGGTVAGTASWYWSGDQGVPPQAELLLRASDGRVVSATHVEVTPVAPPAPEQPSE